MSGTLQVGGLTLGTHNSGTGKVDITNAGETTVTTLNTTSIASGTIGTNVTLPGYSGGSFTSGNEWEGQGDFTAKSAGCCINAYYTFRGTSTIRTSSSPTTDGVYIVVTPRSAASKFLLIHCGHGYYDSGSDTVVRLRVFRHINANPARGSATDITESFNNATGTGTSVTVMNAYQYNLSYNDMTFKLDWQGMDDPNTTTKVGYYLETLSNGGQYRYPQGKSYLTVLEFAG